MVRAAPATGDRGLHAQVVNALGEEIMDGRLATGSILNVDELGERFGVGRSVLREAFRVLQSLGMVEPRQRVGTQVLSREAWDLLNPQLIYWRGRGREYVAQMRDLLEMRLGIEPVAARLSAVAMTPEQALAVRASADAMVAANEQGDSRRFLEADIAFHSGILRASGNAVISNFASTVEALLRTRTEERRLVITSYSASSAERHDSLAQALIARDADLAYRCSFELIEATIAEFVLEFGATAR